MHSDIDAASIIWFHDRQLRERDWPVMSVVTVPPGAWAGVAANHRYNGLLWREEEQARRLDVPPSDIAAGLHLIDRYHRKRNEAVEAIDAAVLASLRHVVYGRAARLSSDSAGTMIDRLSVLSLKIGRMRRQAQGDSADDDHRHAGADTLQRLLAQRQDLLRCLDTLLVEARTGLAYFNGYRQAGVVDDSRFDSYSSAQIGGQPDGMPGARTAGPPADSVGTPP